MLHHRDRKEDQRGCYGAQAHRFERSARFGLDIGPWKWWWRIETERFRHVVPPENLKIDCVPAEYPDDPADSPQPSHRRISGRCRCCMDLVYHRCWLATCSPAVQDDFHRLLYEGGPAGSSRSARTGSAHLPVLLHWRARRRSGLPVADPGCPAVPDVIPDHQHHRPGPTPKTKHPDKSESTRRL